MIKEINCIIKGKVQMVMFRDFVQKQAFLLDIKGEVRNLNDGTVEVIAQGLERKLKLLIEQIKKGSALAEIEDIIIRWSDPEKKFKDFKIV
jgi:acylphosphatase